MANKTVSRVRVFTATRRTKVSAALIFAVNVWLLFFIGCAPQQKVWVKQGASTQDFNQDKYRCIQESTRKGYSGNAYGYSGGEYTNWNVYNACMESAGWSLVPKQ
jgi:hypothetical protein